MNARMMQAGIAIGPVLFIIAILGLLATAIAAGSASFTGRTNTETARAGAAAILAYAEQLKTAVDRMRYNTDFGETQISFIYNIPMQNGTIQSNGFNNTSCSSDACRIFRTGGVTNNDFYQYGHTPATIYQNTWQRVGSLLFRMFNVEGIGTASNELVLLIVGLRTDIGNEIARRLNQAGTTASSWTGSALTWSGAVDETWFSTSAETLTGSNIRGREAYVTCNAEYCDFHRILISR